MTVDAEGYLWCAMWGGSRVNRCAPNGTLDRSIGLPASQPTSVALSVTAPFSMVITTATHGLPKPLRHDGRALKAQSDVGGLALKAFAAHGVS
jgi:sugar lactone lactonase YvrE